MVSLEVFVIVWELCFVLGINFILLGVLFDCVGFLFYY